MNQSIRRICLTATAACGLLLASASAQTTATTDPVGAMTFDLTPNADNPIALPLRQPEEADLEIQNVTNIGGDEYLVAFSDFSASVDQYSQLFYLRFVSGAANGMYFTIISNDENEVTLDGIGVDLSVVEAGDRAKIVKYWTLEELFPPNLQGPNGPLVPSSGNLSFQRGSIVLLPDISGSGINLAPASSFFVKSQEQGGWTEQASGFPSANKQVLLPDTFFFIRQPDDAGARTLTVAGNVFTETQSVFLYSRTSGKQDNFVAYINPVDTTLSGLNLGDSFADSTGNLSFQRGDVLYLYPDVLSINPALARSFFRVNGEWRQQASGFPSSGNEIIPAGTPIVIRKAETTDGRTSVWSYSPNF